ncbi:TPA: hypothetical protein ACHWV7_002437, partial [Legionella pneumophila]
VETLVNNEFSEGEAVKADIAEPQKAATPLKDNNYIYLLSRFEQFWNLYPEKKSHERAFEAFRKISPDEHLLRMMLQALENQIKARNVKIAHGEWVPPWKYPSNWLVQKCWEDEVKIEVTQEKRNAKRRPNTELTTVDPFWNPEGEDTASTSEDEYEQSNVINLGCYRQQ